jgi:non-specific protein-tyrosine kinase
MSKLKKAMERAKLSGHSESHRPAQERPDLARETDRRPEGFDISRSEINPTYSQTRVVNVDPAVLRKNKVISLFHEEAVSDQLKILRTQVLDKMAEIGGNSLLVTSPGPGQGKTLIAINLAVSISHEVDHTVLLVDTNLRTPCVHRYFGLNEHKGLSDYLTSREPIPNLLINPGIQKFVILPAGKSLPNSAELLGGPRMESLVTEIKARYPDRFIVFDSPSFLACADPLVCSSFIDAVLLVVEAERTSSKDVEKALSLMKDKPLIGTVFNKAKG